MSATAQHGQFVLIGVDGGATEVKAHHVLAEGPLDALSFRLGDASGARKYERVGDFGPVDVAKQLAQRGAIQFGRGEREQGRRYVAAASEAIVETARQTGAARMCVGIGMPGLKTSDGRGIDVMNNGPRIPDYLDQLEGGLTDAGIELVAPVARLGSDAEYCGIGEEYAADGLFRGVENAYYVGGGTGIADAMKLHGELVPFDEAKAWLQKAWQIPSCLGPTFEKLASAGGLNSLYANLIGATVHELAECGRFPECDAVRGSSLAITTLDTTALVLAELIYERIRTRTHGRAALPHRGQAYRDLTPDHPYRGTLWDRVVIGQRIGRIYGDPKCAAVFRNRLDASLARLIADSGDAEFEGHYLDGERLRDGLVVASKLRAAPAIGAAIDAASTQQTTPFAS